MNPASPFERFGQHFIKFYIHTFSGDFVVSNKSCHSNKPKKIVPCIALYYFLYYLCSKINCIIFFHAMNVDNVQSQMRKGILEYCILLILDRKPSYAPDIIATLKDARIIVVEGTLYPLLTRLKNSGLLSYQWEESNQGPPRKYYSLTDEGKAALLELENAWSELNNTVTAIKNIPKA